MNGITVFMALVDSIPVILYFIATVILQRDLYNKLSKVRFALLSAGSIMVLLGGIYKVTWKLLYALGVCDYRLLSDVMFPMQAPGFFLVFAALLGGIKKSENTYATYAVAPVLYTSKIFFIIINTIGSIGSAAILAIESLKRKNKNGAILFGCSILFVLVMGGLGSKFDDSSAMNWVSQIINIVTQGSFLAGVIALHSSGLAE